MKSDLRVIKQTEPEESCAIHEVFYDDDGHLVSFTSQPIAMKWQGKNAGEVLRKIKEMEVAISMKRWLTLKDFGLSQ